MRQNPYLNGTKAVSTETWNRIYILWFLTLWFLGGMNHPPVRHDLTSSLLWLELHNLKGMQWMQNIGFASIVCLVFFKLYTHMHIKPMYRFLWVLFFNTLFPFTSILVRFLVRATSLTCAFRMPGYKGRATYESFGNAQKTAVQICINCAETFKFCKLCVGEINTRNGNNYIRVKKEFLLEGKLGEQILSLSIWLDLIVTYDKL